MSTDGYLPRSLYEEVEQLEFYLYHPAYTLVTKYETIRMRLFVQNRMYR